MIILVHHSNLIGHEKDTTITNDEISKTKFKHAVECEFKP